MTFSKLHKATICIESSWWISGSTSLINGFLLAFLQLNFLISSTVSLSLIQTGVNEKGFFFLQWIDFFSDIQGFFSKLKNFQSRSPKKSEMAQIKKHKFEAMESNLTFESSNVRKNQ